MLIYHTHSQEAFLDSREGVLEDSVVGVGDLLTEILKRNMAIMLYMIEVYMIW